MTIEEIKRHLPAGLPSHWVQDWLCHVINQSPTFLYSHGDYELNDSEQAEFDDGIAKMQAGTPLAYLTGKQAFWDLEFIVNEHTLIPRSDTEVLIEQVLAWIDANYQTSAEDNNYTETPATKRLLDLGTGSGCIAITLASELHKSYTGEWQVIGVDNSAEALTIARQNAKLNQVPNVTFMQSDWYATLDSIDEQDKFAVIVSNPPYISESDAHLANLKTEPHTALVADEGGLADIRHIVKYAPKFLQTGYLQAGGLLAIEHGHDQGEAVRAIFNHYSFDDVRTVQDYGGNERLTMGVMPCGQ